MNILILGKGAREHCLTWKIKQCATLNKIYVSPGNAGIELLKLQDPRIETTSIAMDNESIIRFCLKNKISLVVVGPEDYLAQGITNALANVNIKCFGPTKKAAKIESSKAFAKDFMTRHNIPTGRYAVFDHHADACKHIDEIDYLVVVKASGLAAGKGVIIPSNKDEAKDAIIDMMCVDKFGTAGHKIVIEEFLEGPEVSLLAFTDGNTVRVMPPAQDYKKAFNNDLGPNTGGMGAFAPSPLIKYPMMDLLTTNIIQKCVDGLRNEDRKFCGVLYAGLILTKDGPKVLEFNARFGDPETQVILPLLQTDLIDIMLACVSQNLHTINIQWNNDSAAVVTLASGNYPDKYKTKYPITISECEHNKLLFHAGTKYDSSNQLITDGGRVLSVTSVANTLKLALNDVYSRIGDIHFKNMQFRTDIGLKHRKCVKLAILGSTRGTDMQYLIDKITSNELNAQICMVLSNKRNSYILERARNHNIPCEFVSCRLENGDIMSRENYDEQIIEHLKEIPDLDLVLLIGYMRILSPKFVNTYRNRIYNVHPSLLPKFAGGMDLKVHEAVLDAKETTSGCTVHIVTNDLDAGPILVQKECLITADETCDSLKEKVQQLEGIAFVEAIKHYQDKMTMELTYKSAGVDIDAHDNFIKKLKPLAAQNIGNFGSMFDLSSLGTSYTNPILVSSTDGVGTKLKLCVIANKYDTIGIDLVAMNVNDILVHGAKPLYFLDYIAVDKLNDKCELLVKGVVEGCKQAGCSLTGGETAQMTGIYQPNYFDLAGFVVGVVDKKNVLPKHIQEGDVILGLSSSGVHSNGLSLVHKIIEKNGINYHDKAFSDSLLIDELLTPTTIYVSSVLPLMNRGLIHGAANITGGGLVDNLPRVLPVELSAEINSSSWQSPPIFDWIHRKSLLPYSEMFRVFNMGIGFVLIISPENKKEVMDYFTSNNQKCFHIGHVIRNGGDRVTIK